MNPAALLAFCVFLQSPATFSQVWKAATDQGFSGGAMVVSGDKTLFFELSNGNRSKSLRISKQTALPICSVTKAMTAEVVLDLIQAKTLSLDGSARKYLPWLPEFTNQITLRQLLTHTSGIRSMDGVLGVDGDGVGTIYRTFDTSLKNLRSRVSKILGDSPASPAGTKYLYNNTDFLVLQLICEEVTHQGFDHLLRHQIFSKAQMMQTHLARWVRSDRSFVGCYKSAPTGYVTLDPFNMAILGGAASIISTPEDLCRWLKFTLADPAGTRMLGAGSQYGGFQGFGGYAFQTPAVSKALGQERVEPAFERPGAVNGYSLQVSFLPERHLAVAVFSNRDGEHLGSIFEGKGLTFDLVAAATRMQ